MAHITIKDLPHSDELDARAMRSIVGGGITGALPAHIERAGTGRIVDYPPGFGRQGLASGTAQPRASAQRPRG